MREMKKEIFKNAIEGENKAKNKMVGKAQKRKNANS